MEDVKGKNRCEHSGWKNRFYTGSPPLFCIVLMFGKDVREESDLNVGGKPNDALKI